MSGTGIAAYGQMLPEDSNTDYSKMMFAVRQALARVRTNVAVKVVSCSNTGLLAPTGTVSVQPQVSMVDGGGNSTPHGIINNVPYFRLQGGVNAVICDPVAGDIGWCAICDRDISSFKNTKASGKPDSWRQFDFADAIYVGGMLNGTPTQYVQFASGGIIIADLNGNRIVMGASGIAINGILFPMGGSGDWATHVHSGVTTGSGDTGPPI